MLYVRSPAAGGGTYVSTTIMKTKMMTRDGRTQKNRRIAAHKVDIWKLQQIDALLQTFGLKTWLTYFRPCIPALPHTHTHTHTSRHASFDILMAGRRGENMKILAAFQNEKRIKDVIPCCCLQAASKLIHYHQHHHHYHPHHGRLTRNTSQARGSRRYSTMYSLQVP